MIQISQWRITAVVAMILLLIVGSAYIFMGFNEEAVRSVVRATARCSVVLFFMAITASSLRSLIKANWTAWLLQNRRYLGVSFALSHGVHLLFLLLLASYYPERLLNELNIVIAMVAVLGYLFLIAMTITSFPKPRQWLGERGWKVLHTTGVYVIWAIFVQTYVPMSLTNPFYLPLTVLLLLAITLRFVRAIKRKNTMQVSP